MDSKSQAPFLSVDRLWSFLSLFDIDTPHLGLQRSIHKFLSVSRDEAIKVPWVSQTRKWVSALNAASLNSNSVGKGKPEQSEREEGSKCTRYTAQVILL